MCMQKFNFNNGFTMRIVTHKQRNVYSGIITCFTMKHTITTFYWMKHILSNKTQCIMGS